MRAQVSLVISLLVAVSPSRAVAQRLAWDGSVGSSSSSWRASASALWQIGVGNRLRLGAGTRLSRFGGDTRSYRSHGASTAGLPARLSIAPAVWALNLAVTGQLRLVGPIAAGASLDLAGIAAGPSRTALGATVEPARWSLFLYGDRDRGSLNSEFFLALAVQSGLAVRAGLSHYVTGYQVVGGPEARRYLRFDTVPFLGVRWEP